jgi:hypothetical protein
VALAISLSITLSSLLVFAGGCGRNTSQILITVFAAMICSQALLTLVHLRVILAALVVWPSDRTGTRLKARTQSDAPPVGLMLDFIDVVLSCMPGLPDGWWRSVRAA